MAAEMPPGLVHSDFDDIHSAVMETARGRWFLAEYARRNRLSDTRMVLDAVARLENVLGAGSARLPAHAAGGPCAATAAQIAERLADIGWDMRERGLADDMCAAVDRQATAVQGLAQRLAGPVEETASAPEQHRQQPCQTLSPTQNPLAHLDALPLASRLEMFV